jgi:hypothetical protein
MCWDGFGGRLAVTPKDLRLFFFVPRKHDLLKKHLLALPEEELNTRRGGSGRQRSIA